MALSFTTKAVVVVTAFSTITLGAVSWTGGIHLSNAFDSAQSLKTTIQQMKSTADNMLTHFNNFKMSAQQQLNDKIALINDLQRQIDALKQQVADGSSNATELQAEIVRLTNELNTANSQAEDLETAMTQLKTEADAIASSSSTEANMDDTLTLDPQNPNAKIEQQQQAPSMTANETSIMNNINALDGQGGKVLKADNVTVSGSTVTVHYTDQNSATDQSVLNAIQSVTGGTASFDHGTADGTGTGSTAVYNIN